MSTYAVNAISAGETGCIGIIRDKILCGNAVAANNLPPQKAAILLRLALADDKADFDNLVRIFAEY